jgi:hypothetical protein
MALLLATTSKLSLDGNYLLNVGFKCGSAPRHMVVKRLIFGQILNRLAGLVSILFNRKTPMSKPNVADRERAIVKHLNEEGSASAREIYEAVSAKLEDSVTREAYYKVLNRMEVAGKIEVQTEDSKRGRIYALTLVD